MKLKTIEDLLKGELKDLYSAENQLVKALPKMAKAASSEELKAGFKEHLEQTKVHVERLKQIGEMLEITLTGKTCKAMKGLVEEGAEAIEEEAEPIIKDAELIGAAQRVEHYEMAAYGVAKTLAKFLGKGKVVKLLEETLNEEKATDEKLQDLAETVVLVKAKTA